MLFSDANGFPYGRLLSAANLHVTFGRTPRVQGGHVRAGSDQLWPLWRYDADGDGATRLEWAHRGRCTDATLLPRLFLRQLPAGQLSGAHRVDHLVVQVPGASPNGRDGRMSRLRVHYLQHVQFEAPANIAAWCKARSHALNGTNLFLGESFPDGADFDWLVIMGGPMSVYDEHEFPWLSFEKRFIERSLADGKRILGVCLGAQLLADVLGARVSRSRYPEVGWFPVRRTAVSSNSAIFSQLPSRFIAFHWHGEAFDLPAGAAHLAESEACPGQAFEYQTALAMQFHLEATPSSVGELIRNCPHETGSGPYVQSAEQMLAASRAFRSARSLLFGMLDRIATLPKH